MKLRNRVLKLLLRCLHLPLSALARRQSIILFLSLSSATLGGCTDQGLPPNDIDTAVVLSSVDASVTEAFIRISVGGPAPGEIITLRRNGVPVMNFHAVSDTTVVDTGLSQGTLYEYDAFLQVSGLETHKSGSLSVLTLLPSNSTFSWQAYLLGDGGASSYVRDAFILNDTLAFAVGEIYRNDSLGILDPLPYNLLKWDGRGWQLCRVTVAFRGSSITVPLEGIFAFSANDIWLAGSIPIHGDGQNWIGYDIQSLVGVGATVSKIWGTSDDLYFVGRSGSIIRYTNSSWYRLESGTTADINDIWGTANPNTRKTEVYCPVTTYVTNGDRMILRISEGSQVDSVPWEPGRKIFSVWTNNGFPLFAAGDGVFENSLGAWREFTLAGVFSNSVRGTGLNDILVAGDFGLLIHFNGLRWNVFSGDPNSSIVAVRAKGTFVIAVGGQGSQGIIMVGRH